MKGDDYVAIMNASRAAELIVGIIAIAFAVGMFAVLWMLLHLPGKRLPWFVEDFYGTILSLVIGIIGGSIAGGGLAFLYQYSPMAVLAKIELGSACGIVLAFVLMFRYRAQREPAH